MYFPIFVNIFTQMLLDKYPSNYFSLHICHPSEIFYKFLMIAKWGGGWSGKKVPT